MGLTNRENVLIGVILSSLLGTYSLVAAGVLSVLELLFGVEGFPPFIIVSLLRVFIVTLFVREVVRQGHRDDLHLTFRRERQDVAFILITGTLSLVSALLNALALIGHIAWIPPGDVIPTFVAALFFSSVEEIEFRVVLLTVVIKVLEQRMSGHWARSGAWLMVSVVFGPIYHIRYFFRAQYFTWTLISLLSFIWTGYVVKRRSVGPTVVLHWWINFTIFLFVGGEISTL